MPNASSSRNGSSQEDDLWLQSKDRSPAWLSLPTEIWERIVSFLPDDPTEQCVFPRPSARFLRDRDYPFSANKASLVSLALTCKQLKTIALRRAYRTIFLADRSLSDGFLFDLCSNEEGRLVLDTCERASYIRALHMATVVTTNDGFEATKLLCLCDIHVALSLAHQMRYLSLHCEDSRRRADQREPVLDHPVVHFLSHKTKCRPRGLSLSLGDKENHPMQRQVSLWHATSFAPLSKLTHLDLVRMIPPANLTAFLLGDASITLVDPDDVLSPLVRDEIEAGLSPHLTLECLRISDLPRKALYHFGDFAVWRKAYDAYRSLSPSERALRAAPRPPESTEECFQFQNSLYNLASNSRKLPSLRLVILDIVTDMHDEPYGALRQLVEEGALKGVSETFPLPGAGDGESYAATGKLALLFGANAKVPEEIIARIGELDDRWQGYVADEDEHWQLVHQGKHDLIQLWNDSRKPANGHDPIPVHTEIRIAADRYQFLSSGDRQREFVCQASSLEALEHAEGSPLSSQDVGIWADPDVFELVKTMPWLSYIQLNEMGCCCWLGGLPRDSNPNPGLSRQKGEEPRLVHPSIVLLDENKLNETGRDEVRARRAQEEEEEEARKRQRTEAAAAEQADAAPI